MTNFSAKAELRGASGLAWIGHRVSEAEGLSRYRLAREVCERFDWRDARGRLKEMACRKELVRLERRGALVLPAARPGPWRASGEAVEEDAAPAAQFCGKLCELEGIELQVVAGGTAESGQWNRLMQAHHPLGSGPLCGAQLRYLIVSRRLGPIGGLSVSAPAWRLSARDDWLGWSDEKRGEQLEGIVCNSRFLIVPGVVVKNLASHALGLLARRIAADWQRRYGIAPWLMETYVEATRSGTVYRAANWTEVGLTAGRGRQDDGHACAVPAKRVFLRVLEPARLKRLCGKPRQALVAGWVHREFAGARLGDRRLEQRLLEIAGAFAVRPTEAIPAACGSWPATKAAYRFFDHESTTMDRLLEPHRGATVERMRREPVVLVVQDTTSLNYTTRPDMQGIGPIGSWANGPKGLMLHNTMAFRPDGLALGLLDVQCWRRTRFGIKKQRQSKAIAAKESAKWLRPLAAVEHAARHCPNSRLVTVCDREADIYELFELAHREGRELLVRAKQDRGLHDSGGVRLRAHMASLAPLAEVELAVPRHAGQPARTARMAVRLANLTLAPPRKKKNLPPLPMTVVWSSEIDPPAGINKPLDWMLLANRPVHTLDHALERLRWYACRWNIEVFHRTLKSGCRIEERQLGTADRLEACLAIDMVVAWRIQHLAWLGRAVPNVPCTAVFDDDQWKAIVVFKTNKPPPPQPPTLRQMIVLVATLGGFLARKSDGDPGPKSLWIGLQRLDDITAGYRSAFAAFRNRPP